MIATETVKAVVGILGGIVLFYLAFLEVRSKGNSVKPGRSLITGIAMSALNPYFIIWWLTVGFSLVMQSAEFGVLGLVLFTIVHEMCDFAWLGFISITSNKMAGLWGEKAYKVLTAISVSILVVFGAYFLMTGVLTLVRVG
jgi:threonine/homoserine/homoserine lactone efflux protein